MEGILAKKVGMTQVFTEDGNLVPVTVLEAGPCLVVQRKTVGSDGYEAVQVGLVEKRTPRKVTKPMQGHFKKAGVAATRRLREFPVAGESEMKAGDEIRASLFAKDELVDVVGTSKGKGFQGVIKRHNFGGGRASHGSMFHRAPARSAARRTPRVSIPACAWPAEWAASG